MAQFFKARERPVFPKRCTWADHCTSWPQKPVPFTGHPLHTDTNCGQKPVAPTHKPRYGSEKTPVPQKAAYPTTACALYISLHTQTPTLLRGTPLFFRGPTPVPANRPAPNGAFELTPIRATPPSKLYIRTSDTRELAGPSRDNTQGTHRGAGALAKSGPGNCILALGSLSPPLVALVACGAAVSTPSEPDRAPAGSRVF